MSFLPPLRRVPQGLFRQFPTLKLFRYRTMSSQTHPEREILPTNVIPKTYRLSLTPDFSTFKFAGKVSIALDVQQPTSSIILNSLELELHSASISSSATDQVLSSKNISFDEEKQIAT